jgi:hypothetical protein
MSDNEISEAKDSSATLEAQAEPAAGDSAKADGQSAARKSESSPAKPSGGSAASRGLPWLLAGLIAGGAGAFFGMRAVKAAEARKDATPCESWKTALCDGSGGAESAGCKQATAASELLSAEACRVALKDAPETLKTLQAARADCLAIVDKLCGDLGKETSTCKMVQDKTPSFPPDRCTSMMQNYDKVIAELRRVEERGGPGAMQRAGGPGGPGGMRRAGAPRSGRPSTPPGHGPVRPATPAASSTPASSTPAAPRVP